MIGTLALIAVVAAVLVPLIRRDLVRARARRRTVTVRVVVDTTQVLAALRRASRAVADIETSLQQVGRTMRVATADLDRFRSRVEAAQPDPKRLSSRWIRAVRKTLSSRAFTRARKSLSSRKR